MNNLVIILSILFNTILNAQNNGGFENWNVINGKDEPYNWQALNILSIFGKPVLALKVGNSNKYSGNFALKIISVHMPVKLLAQLPNTFDYACNGNAINSTPSLISGTSFTTRSEKISFYTKYIPVGLDIGLIGVVLHRNTATGRDTIAFNREKKLPNRPYTF